TWIICLRPELNHYRNHFFELGRRWGHPGQQHGLLFPLLKSCFARSIRCRRVSSFFADVTQQIHSFLANGVMPFQATLAAGFSSMALRKSAGSLCKGPVVGFFFISLKF